LAWSVTEVVRYLFYFCGLLGHVPYALFWLRYSLFMVLYPMGITGEMFQTFVGMNAYWTGTLWYRVSVLVVLVYLPGSPYMILNMWSNRVRSFKKKHHEENKTVAIEEPDGVAWPLTKKGDRSSTDTNKAILAAAAIAGPAGRRGADMILNEKQWRFKYNKHIVEHVKQSLESTDACVQMAQAGLACAHDMFKLVRKGQAEISLSAAMDTYSASDIFETAELQGHAHLAKRELSLQYGGPCAGQPYYKFESKKRNVLNGHALRQQLNAWVEYGSIEKDVADALKELQRNQDQWLDLSDVYFVLLGAASAMGPLEVLLQLGANVVAVARPRALKGIFKKVKNSPGRLLFPVKKGSDWRRLAEADDIEALSKISGCDLMQEPPEIANWLTTVAPGKKLCIGNYTYLDGAAHVQIAVACDAIMQKVCKVRAETALAFLPTPTDALVVTDESAHAAHAAYKMRPVWCRLYESIGLLKQNKPVEVGPFKIIDSIEAVQGPNYILAKRLQHWRSIVAHHDGHQVSTNVSPTTATESVMLKSSIVAAIGGMHIFKPMEVFFQELSMTVMAALLIHDLRNPESAAQPSATLHHPLCLLQRTSFHGGLWRCPYTMTSITVPSAIHYYFLHYWPIVLLFLCMLGSLVQYLATGATPVMLDVLPNAPPQILQYLASALAVPLGNVHSTRGINSTLVCID